MRLSSRSPPHDPSKLLAVKQRIAKPLSTGKPVEWSNRARAESGSSWAMADFGVSEKGGEKKATCLRELKEKLAQGGNKSCFNSPGLGFGRATPSVIAKTFVPNNGVKYEKRERMLSGTINPLSINSARSKGKFENILEDSRLKDMSRIDQQDFLTPFESPLLKHKDSRKDFHEGIRPLDNLKTSSLIKANAELIEANMKLKEELKRTKAESTQKLEEVNTHLKSVMEEAAVWKSKAKNLKIKLDQIETELDKLEHLTGKAHEFRRILAKISEMMGSDPQNYFISFLDLKERLEEGSHQEENYDDFNINPHLKQMYTEVRMMFALLKTVHSKMERYCSE